MHRLKELIIEQSKYESGLLVRFEKELKNLPEGSLCLKKIKGHEYIYFQRTTKYNGTSNEEEKPLAAASSKIWEGHATSRRLLSSKSQEDQELIRKIRRKFFLKKSIEKLQGNAWILGELLKRFNPYDPAQIIKVLRPVYKELQLMEFRMKRDQEIEAWKSQKPEESGYYSEGLKHITASGIRVRSKSEAIIADLLDSHQLLYKYEEPLFIGREKHLPDFTVIRNYEKIYWEHFGMTHDPSYREAMEIKLGNYAKAGILPWKNLVVTFETDEGAIDVARINEIISKMLL